MDKINLYGLLGIILALFLLFGVIFIGFKYKYEQDSIKFQKGIESGHITQLNWNVSETISYTYEQCKNINRSKEIKRIFKDDYRLPLCPKAYVILYDKNQNKVFKFNENNKENPSIITTSVYHK